MYSSKDKFFILSFLAPLLLILATQAQAAHKYIPLYHDMGNGKSPYLTLTLSANNAGMKNGTVTRYHETGNIPNKQKNHYDYSVWDVHDQYGHYFGSFTLLSDNNHVLWDGYAAPADNSGYYLEGIQFAYDNPKRMATLKVSQIHSPKP